MPHQDNRVKRVLAREQPRDVPYGYCKCGCGEKTKISRYTDRRYGYVTGEPKDFLSGHGNRTVDTPWEERDTGYQTPCWIWLGALHPAGYGHQAAKTPGGTRFVHRQHYEAKHGPVPTGLDLDHLCRVRRCVNPDHLEPVTRAENARRGAKTKLTVDAVRAIRASERSDAELAAIYSVAPGTIWNVRHTQWRDVA